MLKLLVRTLLGAFSLLTRAVRRVYMMLLKTRFKEIGKNVVFDPMSYFSYQTIEIGTDVFIGPKAFFSAPRSAIVIGNKVMFGPNVTILGGDHNTSQIGAFMFDVHC